MRINPVNGSIYLLGNRGDNFFHTPILRGRTKRSTLSELPGSASHANLMIPVSRIDG